MAVISHRCPHCGTERSAFNIDWEAHYKGSEPIVTYQLLGRCSVCRRAVTFLVETKEHNRVGSPKQMEGDPQLRAYKILESWPQNVASPTPDFLPERVLRAFGQGLDNLARNNWEAAGMSFRRALEMATKEKLPNTKGTLKDRIDDLSAAFAITSDLKDFAHQVRIDGNDAAHDFDFTEAEAKDISEFTRLFLMYLYTLPGMLAARKQAKAQPAGKP